MATKEKRREYGAGSVFYDTSRQRWIGRIEAGWSPKGTRRRIKISARTKPEAEAKVRAKRRQLALEGAPSEAGSDRVTVKAWAERWLKIKESKLRPSAFMATRSQVTQWVIPTIGHRRLSQLNPSDVRAVHRAMAAASLAQSSIIRAHVTLQKILKDAILEGYQIREGVTLVEGPEVGETDRDAIPLPDALAILKAAGERKEPTVQDI